jgi:hypothetical protein
MHTSRKLVIKNVDARRKGGALVEDDRRPWWEDDDPELEEIRRRTLEEFERELEARDPVGTRRCARRSGACPRLRQPDG